MWLNRPSAGWVMEIGINDRWLPSWWGNYEMDLEAGGTLEQCLQFLGVIWPLLRDPETNEHVSNAPLAWDSPAARDVWRRYSDALI